MADLTAIILTYNEEKNIRNCITSVRPIAKRIIVGDSGSTDNTVEYAKELGAEVMVNVMKPFLYAKQFLYAMDNADIKTQWVFRIDADEELTEESAKEIDELCNANANTDINGLVVRFGVCFMGRELKHGGIYPFKKLLVFKYGKGNIEDRQMDEHIVLFEGRSIEVKHDSLHHDYKDLSAWIDKHNNYSSREAMDYYLAGDHNGEENAGYSMTVRIKRFIKYHIYYKLPMGSRAHLYYWYRYYLKLGFLDGREGKIFAFLQAYWYRFLVDAKLYEQQIKEKENFE